MTQLSEEIKITIEGHVDIFEYESLDDVGDVNKAKSLIDKYNSIHAENMSLVIAKGLANKDDGSIYSMHFGTGGATIDPLGDIIYASPNVTGAADLNMPVYFEVVDSNKNAPEGNQMSVRHINGTLFSDVEVRCVIDKNEPWGQPSYDNIADTNINDSTFVFDEIGLKNQDGLLLTHIVFSPIEKSANRIIEIVYVLRCRLVA